MPTGNQCLRARNLGRVLDEACTDKPPSDRPAKADGTYHQRYRGPLLLSMQP
jgi:hypothetical protein